MNYGLPYGEPKATYTLWPMEPKTEAEIVEMLDNSIANALSDPAAVGDGSGSPEQQLEAEVTIGLFKAQRDLFLADPASYLKPEVQTQSLADMASMFATNSRRDLRELDHALAQGYIGNTAYAAGLDQRIALLQSMASSPPPPEMDPQEAEQIKNALGQVIAEYQSRKAPAPVAPATPAPSIPTRPIVGAPPASTELNWPAIGFQAAIGAVAGKMLFDNSLVGAVSAPLLVHFVGKLPKGS